MNSQSQEKSPIAVMCWSLALVASHFFTTGLILGIVFCKGALGSGYDCTIPVGDLAAISEISMIVLLPVWSPILYWIIVPRRFRFAALTLGGLILLSTFGLSILLSM